VSSDNLSGVKASNNSSEVQISGLERRPELLLTNQSRLRMHQRHPTRKRAAQKMAKTHRRRYGAQLLETIERRSFVNKKSESDKKLQTAEKQGLKDVALKVSIQRALSWEPHWG
jgi:hypothetical protein